MSTQHLKFTRRFGSVLTALAVAAVAVPVLAERVGAVLPQGETAITTVEWGSP